MRINRINNDLEVITRKGNVYRAIYLYDGWFNVWDEQSHEVIVKIKYMDELFETIAYREFHMN
jgi:hypothetical protein